MEIQIVLTTDNTFFSRLARLLGAEWTHAMLRFCSECADGRPERLEWPTTWCFQHYRIIEAGFCHGVVERVWDAGEYSRYVVYRVETEASEYVNFDAILHFARGNIGKFYAFDKLLLMLPRLLRRIVLNSLDLDVVFDTQGILAWEGQRGHICSSLVDEAFYYGNLNIVPLVDTPWVLPDDIRDSPLLEKIEESRKE